nr:YiiX/YebB-like N1pC/P60 family cysteine hydrolase [Thiocapsa sp. KS1]
MIGWLTKEGEPHEVPLCDFKRLSEELQPGDVLLVEGRTRVAGIIKLITQSAWTHAALYLGRLHDIEDRTLRNLVVQHYQRDHSEQLLLEALIGQGTRISPLSRYANDHLRICRPHGLSRGDAQEVIAYAVRRLGSDYDVRQLLDLARFFLPWSIVPRRWRSSLFQANAGGVTRTVCAGLIAESFGAVDFPILPFIDRRADGTIRFFKRNPRLFTPRDFDYSPYFDIIKYPFLGIDEIGLYRLLPWCRTQVLLSDGSRFYRAAVSSARMTDHAGRASAGDLRCGCSETAASSDALSVSVEGPPASTTAPQDATQDPMWQRVLAQLSIDRGIAHDRPTPSLSRPPLRLRRPGSRSQTRLHPVIDNPDSHRTTPGSGTTQPKEAISTEGS